MRKGSVLLVEDSAVQRRLIQRFLADCERPVETASNGREALQQAKALDPDLIIMDIDMPEMDGLDACRALTRDPSTRHIPVVMLSACGEKACQLRATMRGAADYLVKPVTRRQLCNTLGPILAGED